MLGLSGPVFQSLEEGGVVTLCPQRVCDLPAHHGQGLVLEGLSRNAARQSR